MVINFVPNGILLSCEETFVPKVLNGNRWLQIEERTIELLGCIQPNHKSEIHRNNVVSYIKDLITNHVPCQVPKLYFNNLLVSCLLLHIIFIMKKVCFFESNVSGHIIIYIH
jgi:hypothetical protein